MLCSCPRDQLCATCREQWWLRAKGTVACRAENWVERERRLPSSSDATAAVADLTEDRELLERFATEWIARAQRRWERARRDSGDWMWR